MEKLTQENIRFIEHYLKNSGVEYADIRWEMTDHVASEIETKINNGDQRGFYEIFKTYMIDHKTTLLKSLKKFRKQADKKVARLVLKSACQPKTLLIAMLTGAVLFLVNDFIGMDRPWQWFSFFLILMAIIGFVYLVFFEEGKKISMLQRLIFWIALFDYFLFLHVHQFFPSETWTIVCAISIGWLHVSAITVLLDLNKRYKK